MTDQERAETLAHDLRLYSSTPQQMAEALRLILAGFAALRAEEQKKAAYSCEHWAIVWGALIFIAWHFIAKFW